MWGVAAKKSPVGTRRLFNLFVDPGRRDGSELPLRELRCQRPITQGLTVGQQFGKLLSRQGGGLIHILLIAVTSR